MSSNCQSIIAYALQTLFDLVSFCGNSESFKIKKASQQMKRKDENVVRITTSFFIRWIDMKDGNK
ncbi:CLUMA_CG010419, isoform A [Clunio marinus]|uniref:CLUMA_CG010419, isoform A n=1 Tax=Clunio marinus TaxID=568069 RepID=A0A1J1I9W7_9DIPT|nr:CLUMA_CG010419, isoform A [Clunio marinus]